MIKKLLPWLDFGTETKAAEPVAPAPVESKPLTICAECIHGRPSKHDDPELQWCYAQCAATVTREAYMTKNIISGIVTHHPALFAYCDSVNRGDCPKFTPKEQA